MNKLGIKTVSTSSKKITKLKRIKIIIPHWIHTSNVWNCRKLKKLIYFRSFTKLDNLGINYKTNQNPMKFFLIYIFIRVYNYVQQFEASRRFSPYWRFLIKLNSLFVKDIYIYIYMRERALCPVVGHSRPVVVACCIVRSGVLHHWIQLLWPRGRSPPQVLTLFGGVWFIARRLRCPENGNADGAHGIFFNCLSRWASALRPDPP